MSLHYLTLTPKGGQYESDHIRSNNLRFMCAQNPCFIPEFLVEDGRGQLDRGATIDVLPDDALLEVFNFYLESEKHDVDAWHELVHVCRRWRQVVFASPRRLNLRLFCTHRTPVKKRLDIWPALPIVIECYDYDALTKLWEIRNIEVALEHNDRVCEITIHNCTSSLSNLMMVPFPALTSLGLSLGDDELDLPDSFLGGSASRLKTLDLSGIPFPGLPKLLLSSHHLVHLSLLDIPDSGYISPEAMVTGLSSLTDLKLLVLGFRSPRHQTNRHQPPLMRTILPSLTSFRFEGVSEYLEDIVALIDVPLLNDINITFSNQPIFDTPLLRSFITHLEAFKAFHRAHIMFSDKRADVTLLQEGEAHDGTLQLGISCNPFLHPSSVARLCNLSLPPLPTLEHLSMCHHYRWVYGPRWQDEMGDPQWLELFHPFITVKSLYLDTELLSQVVAALQELAGGSVTEVSPSLQNIFVQGPIGQPIEQFIAARQLLGHPVAVQNWDGYECGHCPSH